MARLTGKDSDVRQRSIVALYLALHSAREIAVMFGISVSAVYYVLGSRGVERRPSSVRFGRLTLSGERPTQAELLAMFDYDPATGSIRRKKGKSTCGEIDRDGYRRIELLGRRYHVAILIWVMMTGEWPDRMVDHKDTYGPKADWGNRWENLRLAGNSENAINSRLRRNNTSGHTGVYWVPGKQKWRSKITLKGKIIPLGYFKNIEDASRARRAAEDRFFGEYRPGRMGAPSDGAAP